MTACRITAIDLERLGSGAKPTRRFARPEWRVSANADAHINGVECLKLVGRRPMPLPLARTIVTVGDVSLSLSDI